MVGNLLLRGMLVGVFAGLLAFGFARIFGEPQVDRAIAFEDQMSQAKGASPEPELVSREMQAGLGLFTGVIVYSAAVGGLFSLVFAFVYGRVGRLGPRATAALLALGGFVAIALVPDLKYPANPPSVGNPETIGFRTELYFGDARDFGGCTRSRSGTRTAPLGALRQVERHAYCRCGIHRSHCDRPICVAGIQ